MMTHEIIEMVRPAVNLAVDRAIHDLDPAKFHRRLSGVCMLCPNALRDLQARLEAQFDPEKFADLRKMVAEMADG